MKTKHSHGCNELYIRTENPEQMENIHMDQFGKHGLNCISKNRVLHEYFIILKTVPGKKFIRQWLSVLSIIYDMNFAYLFFFLFKPSIFFLNSVAFRLHLLFTKFSFIKGDLNLMQSNLLVN